MTLSYVFAYPFGIVRLSYSTLNSLDQIPNVSEEEGEQIKGPYFI